MNRLIIYIFILIGILSTNRLYCQSNYATVHIYKDNALSASIYFNDKYVASLKHGHLEYRVFNVGTHKVTISNDKSYANNVTINLVKGRVYYYEIKTLYPAYLGYTLKPIQEIPDTKRSKEEEFILSDVGDLNFKGKAPDSDWTEIKVKEHWKRNGMDDFEGIYENISAVIENKLAVIKENNQYRLIYLNGAEGTNWQEGDIKAELLKSAQYGIFKANWYTIDKQLNSDVLVTFENSLMRGLSETGSGQEVYLKTYPTYDQASSNINSIAGSGTGFFINKEGYLVTNYHVINQSKEITIEISSNNKKQTYPATVVQVDKQNDLAILKISNNSQLNLDTIKYNLCPQTLDIGSEVFTLGYPLIESMGTDIKFTDGKISSKTGFQGDITTYQISVPIQPGNSGGPLFNNNGELVGITNAGFNRQIADNANYAIKVDYLKLLVNACNEKIDLPGYVLPKQLPLTEKIKILTDYIVIIKVY